ncbi:MAG: hydantoinase/oxoprolinase family protein [Lachnospiraceae bacterium]|nr:hydantoinase/oxoprolinase family protein [Lachnospiraceae bacterium]
MLGIGIDTGGTCTDAVIYDFDSRKILAGAKTQTTRDRLETGIAAALDALPQDLLERCEMISLSTTLATNACVENKGARAKLLMLGFDWEMIEYLKTTYASYGLDDLTRFVVMDAKVEGYYSNPFDPDWEALRENAEAYFADCDSVGIVQKHPRANGGRFELTALKILKEVLDKPITISFDISNETDILKTCAGTLLNARLIPLIAEFMEAVRHVMKERGMDLPMSIIRSDGTMFPEETARLYPVETILCGPAASVVGGCELAGCDTGLIVDMGGTTTDIALVRSGEPVLSPEGIWIGQWKTMVKGLYVKTFGLGGDSAVRYADEKLRLDTTRIVPISVLAAQYPGVLPQLEALAEEHRMSIFPIHEFYIRLKDISGKEGYTEQEQQICELLGEGPLIARELASRMGKYIGLLKTDRLEADGVIIRSGLTPTDMMIIKGDFDLYDGAAARTALRCVETNTGIPVEQIPDLVYEMVFRKLYKAVGRVILKQQFPKNERLLEPENTEVLLDSLYEQAVAEASDTDEVQKFFQARMRLTTDYPLIGVGAPVHVFLPRVARLLGTEAVIPPYAGVANALGAAASPRIAMAELKIKAVYEKTEYMGLALYENGVRHTFEEIPAAVAYGKEAVRREVLKKAALYGLGADPQVSITVEENRFGHRKDGVLFEIIVRAKAV